VRIGESNGTGIKAGGVKRKRHRQNKTANRCGGYKRKASSSACEKRGCVMSKASAMAKAMAIAAYLNLAAKHRRGK